jgi:hypothetical protein
MNDDKAIEKLSGLIDEAFDRVFGRSDDVDMIMESNTFAKNLPSVSTIYESIEDYTATTGKRFRMTKEQKELGLTREEAFTQTYGETN